LTNEFRGLQDVICPLINRMVRSHSVIIVGHRERELLHLQPATGLEVPVGSFCQYNLEFRI
jgi:hypothetical protein